MSASPGIIAYRIAFELTPVMLTRGLAGGIPGGMLPLIALTQAVNFTAGLLGGSSDLDLNNYFASFYPLAGSTLVQNDIGEYTFANAAVAANAIIAQPLKVSLMMLCPAKGEGGYGLKIATMTALQATLAQHSAMGGTFTVLTPSFSYTNTILRNMEDVSPSPSVGGTRQPQVMWRLDFEMPLVSQQQAQQAQNSTMSKISSGVQTDGSQSGLSSAVGVPSTVTTPAIAPSAGTPSGGVAGLAPTGGLGG